MQERKEKSSRIRSSQCGICESVQGYLAHKKPHPPRALHKAYLYGPMTALGGGAFSYERGAPVMMTSLGVPARIELTGAYTEPDY